MCTAVSYCPNLHYFGRTLDLEYSYNETVTVTPARFPLPFRHEEPLDCHYAMIGMAYIQDHYPLYYDAVNEKGLAAAGLNFPGNAVYHPVAADRHNIASFELIPWLLSRCASVSQAKKLLQKTNITDTAFNPQLQPTPLHWLLADKLESIVIEQDHTGLHLHENPWGILTNNPPFPSMTAHLSNYMNLSAQPAVSRFSPVTSLSAPSRGMGAMGLPGDLSSQSRFVRAAFVKENAVTTEDPDDGISQFFHILGAVTQQRGCVRLQPDVYEISVYSSCCIADKGIYCYKTYGNSRITAVDMHRANLDGTELISYPLLTRQDILLQNG